jgi:beta-glucosidase-like glycosyl hydrolase
MSHVDLAELAARESMVLLKNENNTLPINRATVRKIAVIGAQRDVHGSVDAGSERLLDELPARLHDQRPHRRPGIQPRVPRSREGEGPFDGIDEAARQRDHRDPREHGQRGGGRRLRRRGRGLTAEDEGEEYTGAGDRTTTAPGAPVST